LRELIELSERIYEEMVRKQFRLCRDHSVTSSLADRGVQVRGQPIERHRNFVLR
jgi:hypothetical protein